MAELKMFEVVTRQEVVRTYKVQAESANQALSCVIEGDDPSRVERVDSNDMSYPTSARVREIRKEGQ